MSTSTHRDPRTVVTPHAFEVSEELFGTPLATPRRRAAALAVDGLVIAVITLVTRSFALVLGAVAAGFFIRAGFKRVPVRGSVFGRAMRLSVGCLGVIIALVTATIWAALRFDGLERGAADTDDPGVEVSISPEGRRLAARGLLASGLLDAILEAESLEEAEEAGAVLLEAAEELGVGQEVIRTALRDLEPENDAWAEGWEGAVARLLGEADPTIDPEERSAIEAEVSGLSDRAALARYAELLRAAEDGPEQEVGAQVGGGAEPVGEATVRRRLLERRVLSLVGADTLAALNRRITAAESGISAREAAIASLEAQLEEAESAGIVDRLRSFLDELGIGFGWAALYLTVILSWWNGQTVGKRVFGIRVVRLDGEPITWWVAFERAGGYAAGLATGLLGFAQVWWDANRQAIHDRIVGTVVVMDGAEPVESWEEAL